MSNNFKRVLLVNMPVVEDSPMITQITASSSEEMQSISGMVFQEAHIVSEIPEVIKYAAARVRSVHFSAIKIIVNGSEMDHGQIKDL